MDKIVIVGAGQAGASAAAELRAHGFAGRLTLIGEEADPPYQRPPLSKKYLLGEMARERLYLRPEAFYAEKAITLRTDARATAIDRAAREVVLGGERLPYDALILATGSIPRPLPEALHDGSGPVYAVRGLADIDRMAGEFREGRKVLIVGGGYIGLEAAAVARQLGLEVVLIEAAPRILARVAAAETAAKVRALHQAHGVDLREGVALKRLESQGGGIRAETSDGEITADFAIIGIGVVPAVALAEAAGLEIDNGIRVDSHGQTSDPAIWAAGDCASFPYHEERIRLESVPNAIEMAENVAANVLGSNIPYQAKPWFWSDQYDVKLQTAGLGAGADRIVERGDSVWYFNGDHLLAVDALNDPRAYMQGKRWIEAGLSPDPARLADVDQPLKTML
ncbi:NAD(P)/FAD-dependent oxidoreductase [Paracoccaceae bacterium GXU_MW_L88]